MGGAGYVFTGDNDAEIMANSAQINLNVLRACHRRNSRNIYSSSACIYPARNQVDPEDHDCSELSAYPAEPDSNYGWEKLFSERMFEAFAKNHGFRIRIARYHNIFGPEGAWNSGKEKHQPPFAGKSLIYQRTAEKLKFGAMVSKLDLFYT